jgi:ArsR family transcriptional regulator
MCANRQVKDADLSAVFNALGSPIRLKILSIISETKRPMHIKAISKGLKMDYAAVYRHIDILKRAGLVQIFEVGRSRVVSPLHADELSQIFSLTQRIKPK